MIKTVKNVQKIWFSPLNFPNIFLTFDLQNMLLTIEKIEEDTEENPGIVTKLDLTFDETNAIMFHLNTFASRLKPQKKSLYDKISSFILCRYHTLCLAKRGIRTSF